MVKIFKHSTKFSTSERILLINLKLDINDPAGNSCKFDVGRGVVWGCNEKMIYHVI